MWINHKYTYISPPSWAWIPFFMLPGFTCSSHWCYCSVTQSCPILSWSHGLSPARLLCPWDFPGKNTGAGCHSLLHGLFLTHGLSLRLLHWQVDCLPLSQPGKLALLPICLFLKFRYLLESTNWISQCGVFRGLNSATLNYLSDLYKPPTDTWHLMVMRMLLIVALYKRVCSPLSEDCTEMARKQPCSQYFTVEVESEHLLFRKTVWYQKVQVSSKEGLEGI